MISFVPSRRIGAVPIVVLLYIIIVIRNSSLCPQNALARKAGHCTMPCDRWEPGYASSYLVHGEESTPSEGNVMAVNWAWRRVGLLTASRVRSSHPADNPYVGGRDRTAKARRTAVSPTKSPGKGAAHRGIRRPLEVGPLIITCTFERDSLTSAWYTKY